MKIFTSFDSICGMTESAVALGNFDGIHAGHAELIGRMTKYAKSHDLVPSVFTFSNHPYNVITGKTAISSVVTEADKEKILEELGVEYLFSFDFDDGFHSMTPAAFIDDMLIDLFGAKAVFCGFNFRFGADAAAGSDMLRSAGKRAGFHVDVMSPFRVGDTLVSSTLIRELIAAGKVDEATTYLGRPFSISGEIDRGNGIGRGLGFPTANIRLPEGLAIPAFGVYVTESLIYDAKREDSRGKLRSVTNVGIRPTIGDKRLLAETHIFGVPDEDLYGHRICVKFLSMLRAEKKFANIEELKKQVEVDKRAAQDYNLTK
jgi:riboflavin kinase/FMN adenylyltransferase